ncbi:MAG: Ti-type conjugative transfer relaxase TraA [Desulfobacteraceae bacterium]|nr:Ti-type conjugative transfer relaxase TraA [Desulfobacteraceae bacterium]
MAIYHLSAKIISRGKGQSAVASASYRSKEKIKDERLGKTFDFSRRQVVAHTEILAPKNAPAWTLDRNQLWNRVEACEKRKDAQLAREIEVSFPIELTKSERIDLIREYAQQNFVKAGMIADICIHEKEGNPHAHIMLTTRAIDENGFGKKNTAWNHKSLLMKWRENWAELANHHLAKAGHELQIDHRSYADQGIDLEPQFKIGTGKQRQSRTVEEHQKIARKNGKRIIDDPTIGLDHITRQKAVFTKNDIYRLANTHSADTDQFNKVCSALFSHPQLIELGKDENGKQRYTTQKVLKAEQDMMKNVSAMSKNHKHKVKGVYIAQAENTRTLTPDQKKALDHICTTGDVSCVIGYAGSGKSYILGAVREAFSSQGYQVKGAALAAIAAEGLQHESGIESQTIARRLIDIENGRGHLTSRDVLIIDEAGMVATRQMHRLIEHAKEKKAKVVLVGDTQQLQPIEAGGSFRGIYEKIGGVKLTHVRRQDQGWQRICTRMLESDQATTALDTYQAKGHFFLSQTQKEAALQLVKDWKQFASQNTGSTIMMAFRNVDVEVLNQHGRKAANEIGHLSGKEKTFETVKGERSFRSGDRILFLKNNATLGVKNGNLGTVHSVSKHSLQVRLDNGNQCVFDARDYKNFDHGYACTIHKLQGATLDRTFVFADNYFDRHTALTALTRHKQDVSLYWSKEQFKDFDHLKMTFTRQRPKELAIDFCTTRAIEPPKGNILSRIREILGKLKSAGRKSDQQEVETAAIRPARKSAPKFVIGLKFPTGERAKEVVSLPAQIDRKSPKKVRAFLEDRAKKFREQTIIRKNLSAEDIRKVEQYVARADELPSYRISIEFSGGKQTETVNLPVDVYIKGKDAAKEYLSEQARKITVRIAAKRNQSIAELGKIKIDVTKNEKSPSLGKQKQKDRGPDLSM